MSWTLIESQTLGSSVASVTLGSGGTLPQTYKTLKLVISARNNWTGDIRTPIAITFNGIGSATYSMRNLIASGSSTLSQSATGQTQWGAEGGVNSALYTANTFSNFEATFSNYATGQAKIISTDGVVETNDTNNYWFGFFAGLNSNTASITSFTLVIPYPTGTNFVAGSTFTLYGLK